MVPPALLRLLLSAIEVVVVEAAMEVMLVIASSIGMTASADVVVVVALIGSETMVGTDED